MTGDASVLGSLHSVDSKGVVRMADRLDTGIPAYEALGVN
jgi:hypothetical protein